MTVHANDVQPGETSELAEDFRVPGSNVVIPARVYARLVAEAKDLASGEDDLRLRSKVYRSALDWLVKREVRIRRAAARPRQPQSV